MTEPCEKYKCNSISYENRACKKLREGSLQRLRDQSSLVVLYEHDRFFLLPPMCIQGRPSIPRTCGGRP